MPTEMINTVILFEKDKADDQFWVETGFEEEDVEASVKTLDMEKDAEYVKITEEWAAKSKTFLAERQNEAAKAMETMKKRQAQMAMMKAQAAQEQATPAKTEDPA